MVDAKPPPRRVVSLRLDPDLHARLLKFAERTERTANSSVVLMVKKYLDSVDRGEDQ